MAQHSYNIADQNGADFLVDLNNGLSATVTNNSGPTAPDPTFPHMLWFDTSSDLMKIRNETNSDWITVAQKDGSGWTPYRQGTPLGTAAVQADTRYAHRANNLSDLADAAAARSNLDASQSLLDEDDFASNSATRPPSQQSAKAYVDAGPKIKAWVSFDGTGTVSIRDSFNVSSITDNGTGLYTVNFATAFADTNYALLGTCEATPGSSSTHGVVLKDNSKPATGSCRINTRTVSGSFDSNIINIVVVR